ncbi:hypothetical protein G4B88_023603 [Cannabis sativa]|uniref:Uncharacterized protein n=1 Tax=Cannabis sativa TaxID=3483 RepID=A0A7J6HW43_CANSA|nr:hypothetical protein G4B88_023603 [Cannabis sativa]
MNKSTTCATVLTRAIFTEGCKSVAAGMNAMDLRRGITMAVDAVVTNLKSRARMISTSEEIAQQGEETNMSNSIGHNLVNQSLVQSKLNSSGIPANTLFQTPSFNQVATRPRKSQSSKDFSRNSLVIRKSKLAMGSRRSTVPRAVLATDQTSEVMAFAQWKRLAKRELSQFNQNSANFMHDGKTLYNELEVVEGTKLDRGYISPYFITNQKTKNLSVYPHVELFLYIDRNWKIV